MNAIASYVNNPTASIRSKSTPSTISRTHSDTSSFLVKANDVTANCTSVAVFIIGKFECSSVCWHYILILVATLQRPQVDVYVTRVLHMFGVL